jgi:hypothetical protein
LILDQGSPNEPCVVAKERNDLLGFRRIGSDSQGQAWMPVLYFDLWLTMRKYIQKQREFWEKTIEQTEVTGDRHPDLPYPTGHATAIDDNLDRRGWKRGQER